MTRQHWCAVLAVPAPRHEDSAVHEHMLLQLEVYSQLGVLYSLCPPKGSTSLVQNIISGILFGTRVLKQEYVAPLVSKIEMTKTGRAKFRMSLV